MRRDDVADARAATWPAWLRSTAPEPGPQQSRGRSIAWPAWLRSVAPEPGLRLSAWLRGIMWVCHHLPNYVLPSSLPSCICRTACFPRHCRRAGNDYPINSWAFFPEPNSQVGPGLLASGLWALGILGLGFGLWALGFSALGLWALGSRLLGSGLLGSGLSASGLALGFWALGSGLLGFWALGFWALGSPLGSRLLGSGLWALGSGLLGFWALGSPLLLVDRCIVSRSVYKRIFSAYISILAFLLHLCIQKYSGISFVFALLKTYHIIGHHP